ncbi:hypothetical protein HHK36_004852 [Tetracentron sinense]|uniref:Protein BZR1 homolog n=1 Tax=Tetracentron sinense TaxID=13715 RepID=A0A835DLS5_TETSI|nr:hypothetical protein HHK36_004852 [Tetracentron sinense]
MKETPSGVTTEERVVVMGRSASEKERTKMRERQRRSITTKIFNGLRKNGGYNLPPRADINDVLRELAREAGWVVEPDGTTYRSSSSITPTNLSHSHLHSCCVAGKSSNTPTPTSSFCGAGGGDCSTTASPHHFALSDSAPGPGPGGGGVQVGPTSMYFSAGDFGVGASSSRDLRTDRDLPLAMYFGMPYGGFGGGLHHNSSGGNMLQYQQQQQQQQLYFQEARASNQNTPVGSPQRRA